MNTFEKVKKLIQIRFGYFVKDINNLKLESTVKDFNLDSLGVIELIMAIEEEFGIEILDEEAEKFKTVGDLVRFIDAYVKREPKNLGDTVDPDYSDYTPSDISKLLERVKQLEEENARLKGEQDGYACSK